MTKETINECVGRLSLLRFFPANPYAIAELAGIINELCVDDAEGRRLTDAALRKFDEWRGPAAFRAFYWENIAQKNGCAACDFYGLLRDNTFCTCPSGRYQKSSGSPYRRCRPIERPAD